MTHLLQIRKYKIVVLMYFSGPWKNVFRLCDHTIILNKLKRTRTGLNNYLKDCKQIVPVYGVIGGTYLINMGVGQRANALQDLHHGRPFAHRVNLLQICR